jgi:hypothetical protein
MSNLEIKDLIAASIDTSVPEPFGTYFFAADDPGAEIARQLERDVFLDAFGNTPAMLDAEYNQYELTSVFLCVIDHRRRVCAGMMRVILPLPGGPGLKSLNDVEPGWGESAEALLARSKFDLDPASTWDIATLAVDRDYRTGIALGMMHIGLYQALARLAKNFDIKWFVAILDYAVYRLIRLQLRRAFIAFGEERPYLGSARSVPACCPVEIAEKEVRDSDPILHELIYVGSTIKDALRQLDLRSAISGIQELTHQPLH